MQQRKEYGHLLRSQHLNEKRLHRAFKESEQVFLVFSVQGSGRFQGVAKMVSNIGDKFCEDFGSANLGGVFDIEWIHQDDVPFQATQHLVNPWNDNKKVQISRDAQELEPNVGKALVDLWEKDLDRSSSREERIDVSSPEDRLRGSEESQQVQPQPQQQQRQQTANATPPARPPQPSTTRQESVIKEETLRMSLLSTAEDKLKRRVKEVFQMGKVSFIDH